MKNIWQRAGMMGAALAVVGFSRAMRRHDPAQPASAFFLHGQRNFQVGTGNMHVLVL